MTAHGDSALKHCAQNLPPTSRLVVVHSEQKMPEHPAHLLRAVERNAISKVDETQRGRVNSLSIKVKRLVQAMQFADRESGRKSSFPGGDHIQTLPVESPAYSVRAVKASEVTSGAERGLKRSLCFRVWIRLSLKPEETMSAIV